MIILLKCAIINSPGTYLREEGSENPVDQEEPQHSHHTPGTHPKRYLGHRVVTQVEPVKITNQSLVTKIVNVETLCAGLYLGLSNKVAQSVFWAT